MSDNSRMTWNKIKAVSRRFEFQLSPNLTGLLKRKGIWSPDGSGEIGKRKLSFKSNGKANMHLTVIDSDSEKEMAHLDFYWKDFQRSELKFTDGNIYQFRSFDFFRGAWSWVKDGSPVEQIIFRVDNPLQRSGLIEYNTKEVSAQERDILLLLGLHLSHYLNTWLITIALIIIGILNSN